MRAIHISCSLPGVTMSRSGSPASSLNHSLEVI